MVRFSIILLFLFCLSKNIFAQLIPDNKSVSYYLTFQVTEKPLFETKQYNRISTKISTLDISFELVKDGNDTILMLESNAIGL